jgi:hypothetical protein
MTNPTIRIHDLETNEVIDREMTDEEYKDFLAASAATEASIAEQKASLA